MCCGSECEPELVSAFLDEELDHGSSDSLTSHLLQCDHCCETMGWMAQIRGGIAGNFFLCDPEEVTQSVMMAIKNEKVATDPNPVSQRMWHVSGTTDDQFCHSS